MTTVMPRATGDYGLAASAERSSAVFQACTHIRMRCTKSLIVGPALNHSETSKISISMRIPNMHTDAGSVARTSVHQERCKVIILQVIGGRATGVTRCSRNGVVFRFI